jgi:hypothetical protein
MAYLQVTLPLMKFQMSELIFPMFLAQAHHRATMCRIRTCVRCVPLAAFVALLRNVCAYAVYAHAACILERQFTHITRATALELIKVDLGVAFTHLAICYNNCAYS